MERLIKDLLLIKSVKLKKNSGLKKGTVTKIPVLYALINLKDFKNTRNCKNAVMSITLNVLMNGWKMKKDVLFAMKKLYDFKLYLF